MERPNELVSIGQIERVQSQLRDLYIDPPSPQRTEELIKSAILTTPQVDDHMTERILSSGILGEYRMSSEAGKLYYSKECGPAVLFTNGEVYFARSESFHPIWYNTDCLEVLMASFYLLEEMSLLNRPSSVRARRDWDKWQSDIRTCMDDFTPKLARTLRDSLFGMALGEFRYAKKQKIRTNFPFCSHDHRSDVYGSLHYFSLEDAEALLDGFYNYNWEASFGGDKWGRIVEKVMRYDELSPKLFCDAVFGAVHNGGIAFTKQFLIQCTSTDSTTYILNKKREGSLLYTDHHLGITSQVYQLILTGAKMKAIDLVWHDDTEETFIESFIGAGTPLLGSVNWTSGSTFSVGGVNYEKEEDEIIYTPRRMSCG